MRFPVNRPKAAALAGLSLLALVAACGHAGAERPLAGANAAGPTNGPAADYPVVLGGPFVVDGVTYTPADTMNFDTVGYTGVGSDGAGGISLAHRTLPLPSYVEVTSLKTGRTILVRAERRGPMSGSNLVEMSPGAAAQLGIEGQHAPIRIRRVNPPEAERALLRSGQQAPARMDTPMSLVAVLMRRLDPAASAPMVAKPAVDAPVVDKPASDQIASKPVAPAPAPKPVAAAPAPKPAAVTTARAAPRSAKPAVAAVPAATKPPVVKSPASKAPVSPAAPAKGALVVQVGAFSSAANAAEAARKVGGTVSAAGKYHRVRIGRFSGAADAASALAKARAAGYSDARIQRAD